MTTQFRKKFAIAALGLVSAFGAAAHVPEDSPLMRYKGFINHMSKVGQQTPGGCCHLKDGQGNLTERTEVGADGKTHYFVTLTEDFAGAPLPNPVEVKIPDDAILVGTWAKDFCNRLKQESPDDPDAATCTAPPVNILWTGPYDAARAEAIRTGQLDSGSIAIYCYYPRFGFM